MHATTAVVLARGLGTRMREDDGTSLSAAQRTAADSGVKGMMPVAGRPLLDYVLRELAAGGVREVVFVVAPDEVAMRDRYQAEGASDGHRRPHGLNVRFAVQAEPRGTADALLASRDAVHAMASRDARGEAHFLMLNADNLYPAPSVAALVQLDGPGLIAYEATALIGRGNIDAARVMQFALLDLAADGTLREIVEKPVPDHPLARGAERWVSMNLWRFTSGIFADCLAVVPSVRGELELADAVRIAIARGVKFRAVRQRLGVLDLSRRADVAVVEALLAAQAPVR